MKKYILILFILSTAWACTKTIDFDDNGIGNLIVLNSIILPDSCVSGSISQSTSILKGNRYGGVIEGSVIEGSVELYENGIKVGQINPLLGSFRFTDIKPKTGNTYRIVVSSNGKQAEAETIIPNQADLISVDTATIIGEWGGKELNCKIKIRDSSDDDYYRLIVSSERLVMFVGQYDTVKTKYYIYSSQYNINSDDPVFKSVYNNFGSDIIDMGPDNTYSIFPDDYFQGKEYSLQMQTPAFYYTGYGNPSKPTIHRGENSIYERKTIHIQKLSKGYYNYMKYLNLYEYYRDNPFSEPVPVYSNVKNGAGIFASFNDEAKFSFEKIYFPFSMDTIKVEKQQNGYNYGGYY